jgi:hypothetical protein
MNNNKKIALTVGAVAAAAAGLIVSDRVLKRINTPNLPSPQPNNSLTSPPIFNKPTLFTVLSLLGIAGVATTAGILLTSKKK